MLVVFTKGSGFVDSIIKLVTRGQYAHCGIVINGEIYQARPSDGVTKSPYVPDSRIWVEVDVSFLEQSKALKFVDGELGCKYDFLGAARFVIGFIRGSKNRWFCSELSGKMLQEAGWNNYEPAWKFNPSSLYSSILKTKSV